MEDVLNWRYATKKFDMTRTIPEKDFAGLLEVLRLSPSSFGLQPWKFIVVKDKSLRQELRKYAWNQPQLTEASHLIVLCTKTEMDGAYIKNFVLRIAQAWGTPVEALEGYQNQMLGFLAGLKGEDLGNWMARQVYIALGILLSECAHRQIDACPMEGFDALKFDEVLKLKELGLHATVLCPVGYRAVDDEYAKHTKVRFSESEVLIVK
jgi:nitroreductase